MPSKLLACAALLAAATTAATAADKVADLRWDKRVVIVFAPEDDGRLAEQKAILERAQAGLDERELVAFAVVGEDLQPIYGSVPQDERADDLRRRFDVAEDRTLTAILIGKDGGVKWRGNEPVSEPQLFEVIDAMPMRR